MSQFVDVSNKSDDAIKKSLDQIYKSFGIPIDYTGEQLTELIKNSPIKQINQSFLNLLVAMNKLQKDETQKSNLDLAIEQFKTGNIDESLINGLNSNLLKLMPTEQLQTGSVFNLSDFLILLRNSGIAETVITNVEQKISPPTTTPTTPTPTTPTTPTPTTTPTTTPASATAVPSYMQPTISSKQRGGEIVLMTMIAVGLLILVIAGNKDKISNTVSNILSCFSSKPSSGGKKSKRMQNKSKRHRKSRRQRKSKRRQ